MAIYCLDTLSNITRAYHRNSKSAVIIAVYIIAATVIRAPNTKKLHILLLLWDIIERVTGVDSMFLPQPALPLDHSHRPSNPVNHKIEQLSNWFVLCTLTILRVPELQLAFIEVIEPLQNIYNTEEMKIEMANKCVSMCVLVPKQ